MSNEEIEQLKYEVTESHKEEIDKYEKDGFQIEWLHLDKWSSEFSDAIEIRIFQPIREFRVAAFRRIAHSRVFYIAIFSAVAWESLHFHLPHEEDKAEISREYSDTNTWIERTIANTSNIPLFSNFIEIPVQTPHLEVPGFYAPINPVYANISGLSANISGHYV